MGGLRLLVGAIVLAAIVATFADTASKGPINPANFFGYFTIQSNLLTVVAGALSGIAALRASGPQPRWLVLVRALATMCMVITGLVYATLLAPLGVAGGVPVPWANWVMHIVAPLLVAVDWALARDREALPRRVALVMLTYPVAWLAVVLVRGATDGRVPYPFLDPSQGYGVVALWCVAIAIAFGCVSSLVVWWSRRRHAGTSVGAPDDRAMTI